MPQLKQSRKMVQKCIKTFIVNLG